MNNAQVIQIIERTASIDALFTKASTFQQHIGKRCVELFVACLCLLFLSAHANAKGTLRYEVSIEGGDLAVRVTRSDVGRLTLRSRWGRFADLKTPQSCDGSIDVRSQRRSRSFVWPAGVDCLVYRVSLERARPSSRVRWPASVTAISPGRALWLPNLAAAEAYVRIDDARPVSVPWSRHAEGWRVPESPGSSEGLVLIGAIVRLDVAGLSEPVAFVGPFENRARMTAWMSRAVESATELVGRFPNPDAQIVLLHVPAVSGSPVPFGHVVRDQGESVRFYVDSDRSLDDLNYDWTAAHELAHLLFPYVNERWISEGFASYWQNVLQVRAGAYSEREGWQRLRRSFDRARAAGQDMTPSETGRRNFGEARMMIYWSGAALALMADVELRRDHGTSLPAVLDLLVACCLPSGRDWTARALFAKLDELSQTRVFTGLLDRYQDQKGMPPTESLFRQLGVAAQDLREDAPLAPIRRQIMGVTGSP